MQGVIDASIAKASVTPEALWSAPVATTPVVATVRIPGSKSATNRALILAALAAEPSTLVSPLDSRDTQLMRRAMRSLGTGLTEDGGRLRVDPISPSTAADDISVDCGLAGTVMRFVPPLACLRRGRTTFDGDTGARTRPMGSLITALRQLGAQIDDAGRGALPFTVVGSDALAGGVAAIDASASSQFVSALLLMGARATNGVTINHTGGAVPSAPHIAMTVAMLREVGVDVSSDGATQWRVSPGPIAGHEYRIEPDLSNAGPFLAAAIVTGGAVTIPDWPRHTTQAGDALRGLFEQCGASVSLDAAGLTVSGGAPLRGIDVDLREVGELTPVLAALCALANSPSRLRGIAHLRGHETDRLAALARELGALGARVRETADGLEINPAPLHGGVFHTYHDHRMAHAAAVLGLAVPNIQVENIATTTKTLPGFVGAWSAMLAATNGDPPANHGAEGSP